MKRKITEVSVFEFFLCMFVILIHLLSEGINVFPKWSVLSIVFFTVTKLTTFAVPAFIFTSALKLFYKFSERKFTYAPFLLDRIRKIYLPYIIMVVIYYIIFVYAFHIYEFNPVSLIKYILNGDLSAQFYFVVLIMQFYLLMPLWILLSKHKSKLFNTIIIFIAVVCSIGFRMLISSTEYTHKIFPSYLVFWILGMYAGMYYNEFLRFLSKSRLLVLCRLACFCNTSLRNFIYGVWRCYKQSFLTYNSDIILSVLNIWFLPVRVWSYWIPRKPWKRILYQHFRSLLQHISCALFDNHFDLWNFKWN